MNASSLLPWADVDERIARRCVCCAGRALRRSPAVLMPFVAKRVFGWEPVEITPAWGLRDIRSGIAYPLCNSVQCEDCGALFLDIRFSDEEMSALYTGYRGYEYTKLRERFEPGYEKRADVIQQGATHIADIEAFLSPYLPARPTVLDWGGDTGINTPFRASGSVIHIFEISDKPVLDGMVKVGPEAIAGTRYDLVVLSHVLEHLPWPGKTIAEIARVMTEDTVLYIESPYEDLMREGSDARDLYRAKKYWHEHINFFTSDSLGCLLDSCGIDVVGSAIIEAHGGAKHWHVFAMACRLRRG